MILCNESVYIIYREHLFFNITKYGKIIFETVSNILKENGLCVSFCMK